MPKNKQRKTVLVGRFQLAQKLELFRVYEDNHSPDGEESLRKFAKEMWDYLMDMGEDSSYTFRGREADYWGRIASLVEEYEEDADDENQSPREMGWVGCDGRP